MTSQVYVGTYAKYNSGSINGAWVNLERFADEEEFLAHCAELHKDEEDPEFMFQDYEGFPSRYYSESGISPEVFQWLALEDHERDILNAYIECTGLDDATIEDAKEHYYGHFESDLDLAYEYVESTGMLSGVDDSIKNYFDYEAFARDLAYDFMEHDGHYFYN